jgi:hypothetical protein
MKTSRGVVSEKQAVWRPNRKEGFSKLDLMKKKDINKGIKERKEGKEERKKKRAGRGSRGL